MCARPITQKSKEQRRDRPQTWGHDVCQEITAGSGHKWTSDKWFAEGGCPYSLILEVPNSQVADKCHRNEGDAQEAYKEKLWSFILNLFVCFCSIPFTYCRVINHIWQWEKNMFVGVGTHIVNLWSWEVLGMQPCDVRASPINDDHPASELGQWSSTSATTTHMIWAPPATQRNLSQSATRNACHELYQGARCSIYKYLWYSKT